jgi:uncharacterized membrane protein YfcA
VVFLEIIIFFLGGIATGLIAGLLGVGGGFLLVPFQILLFPFFGVPTSLGVKLAIGSSLATVIFTSLVAFRAHNKHGTILWSLLNKIAFGTILGSGLGAYFAMVMPSILLEVLFGVLACVIGFYFLFPNILPPDTTPPRSLPSIWLINLVGLSIGLLSAMLGIGGGLLFVPVLVLFFRVSFLQAIGTSSAVTCLISFFGALVFLVPSISHQVYPKAFGYLYLPSFFPMMLGSVLAAPLGVRLSRVLSRSLLKRIFALIIITVGVFMILPTILK